MTGFAVAIFMAVFSFQSAGAADATGAFGFEFGQVFDTAQHEPLGEDLEGGVKYAIRPDNPYGLLTEYTVTVTPRSHRVYRITAQGTFSSMKGCRAELARLEQVLERKYVKTSGRTATKFGDTPEIKFGRAERKVHGKCAGKIMQKRLTLTYVDETFARIARDESRSAAEAGLPSGTGSGGRDESGL